MLRLTIAEKIFLAGHTSLVISIYLFGRVVKQSIDDGFAEDIFGNLLYVTIGTTFGASSLFLFDIYLREPSETHTLYSLRKQYMTVLKIITIGRLGHYKLLRLTTHVARAQQKCLKKLLARADSTKYSVTMGLNKIRSAEDFIKVHKLTSWKKYKTVIENMMSADVSNEVVPGKPIYYGVSNQNCSEPTYFPYNSLSYKHWRRGIYKLYFAASRQYSCFKRLKKHLHVYIPPKIEHTADGIRVGDFTGLLGPSFGATTPEIAYKITNEEDLIYLHARFSIPDRNVERILVKSPKQFQYFINFLEKNWPEICSEIASGKIKLKNTKTKIFSELTETIHPNEFRAFELRNLFAEGFESILPKIWPTLQVIQVQSSGIDTTMLENIRIKYCGQVPTYLDVYSTAAAPVCGINCLWTAKPCYVPTLDQVFFEFKPLTGSEKTLLLHEVNEGEQYELIVTTAGGLYRYMTGEIIQIVGFLHQVPLFERVNNEEEKYEYTYTC